MARSTLPTTVLTLLALLLPSCSWSSGFSDLRLSVVPRKDEVLLGEPVVLVLTFVNEGEGEIRLPHPVEQSGSNQGLEVAVRHESGLENKARPLSIVCGGPPDYYLSLAPGDSIEVVWVVGGNSYGSSDLKLLYTGPCGGDLFCWVLPVPGTYAIEVVYRQFSDEYWAGEVADTTQTTVLAPKGDSYGAYNTWVGLRPAEGLAGFGSHPYSQANCLPDLRIAFPLVPDDDPLWESPYAPYARHLFALSPHVPSDRAIALGRLLATPDLQDYVLYDEVLFEFAETLMLDGNLEDAAAIRDQARGVSPRSVHGVDYQTRGEGQ